LTTIEQVQQRAESDAKTHGYYLNPNSDFLKNLIEGLKKNEDRYGYPSCPCRLASGIFEFDRDIICPCDYRDPDVVEFGGCYCALYVRKDVFDEKTEIQQIPERRPIDKQNRAYKELEKPMIKETLTATSNVEDLVSMELWYCKQCGYVVFRENPPYLCPICKAKKEMFAKIRMNVKIQ